MERLPLQLAPGEQIVRQCDYRQVSAKRYERVENFTLTNRRLISRSTEQEKDNFTADSYEIPIDEIDTVKTYYRQEKKPVSLTAIIFAVILFAGAITSFILAAPFYIGLVALLVAALIVILAFVLRKTSFAFSLDVSRLGGRSAVEHLSTDRSAVKSEAEIAADKTNTETEKKTGGKIAIFKVLQVLCTLSFLGLLVYAIITITQYGGRNVSAFVPFLAGASAALAFAVMFGGLANRATKKSHTAKRRKEAAAVANKASLMKATVTIATGEITAFLDEVGALIENYKTKTDNSELI